MSQEATAVDNLSKPLRALLDTYAERAGTSPRSAIRDVLTELLHECDRRGEFFNPILAQARGAYREEVKAARDNILDRLPE